MSALTALCGNNAGTERFRAGARIYGWAVYAASLPDEDVEFVHSYLAGLLP